MDECGEKQKDTKDNILQAQIWKTKEGFGSNSMPEAEWCLHI